MRSRLLDLRDCDDISFKRINEEMRWINLMEQPWWFRPIIKRNKFLQQYLDFDFWARQWEYPWAIKAAQMQGGPLRILDVGGGGSPFAPYLALKGHEVCVIDPSMNNHVGMGKSFGSRLVNFLLGITGIKRLWGNPCKSKTGRAHYFPYSAQDIKFPDKYFDVVFCLSVMEHIPQEHWQRCMKEFERVMRPKGKLVITLDMGSTEADNRLYLKLTEMCSLKLIGDPHYDVPISKRDKLVRHPGHAYETIGLLWRG